jgi:DNA-binding MarR family transcriptional regulator
MTHLSGASSPEIQSSAYDSADFSAYGESACRSGPGASPESGVQFNHADVQKLIDARRLRARFFDENLFADPAWDILLDLYRAHLAQQRICVTSVCFGAGVPVSTALRWLNALEERDLARRSQDPLDGRRFFVELTPKGVSAMKGYFAAGARPLAV